MWTGKPLFILTVTSVSYFKKEESNKTANLVLNNTLPHKVNYINHLLNKIKHIGIKAITIIVIKTKISFAINIGCK